MIKASQINTSAVSGLEIGRCHKIFEGSTPVWMVESESDPDTEYKVKHSKEHGFSCTCKAGLDGFAHCSQGVCKHVRWSVAAEAELRAAFKELEAAIAVQTAMSDPETIKAAQVAAEAPIQVKRNRATAPYQPKAFSLLRV